MFRYSVNGAPLMRSSIALGPVSGAVPQIGLLPQISFARGLSLIEFADNLLLDEPLVVVLVVSMKISLFKSSF